MRVISDKKDYYDCMQRLDWDRSTLYVRKPRVVKHNDEWPFPKPPIDEWNKWISSVLTAKTHIVGFCGKIYPLLDVAVCDREQAEPFKGRCWTLRDVDAFLHGVLTNDAWAEFCSKDKRYRRAYFHSIKGRRLKCEKFFAECAEKIDAYKDVFEKSPVFVATDKGREWQI